MNDMTGIDKILWLSMLLLFFGCSATEEQEEMGQPSVQPHFELIDPSHSKIFFSNDLPEDGFRNILRYQYYYNGGGVAIGDVDNDGLSDICLASNIRAPELYLNQGDFQFIASGKAAGLSLPSQVSWNTGIAMADINADGFLDIYLCRSGNLQPDNRRNLLFINQGDGTFAEMAGKWGLDDAGYSIQAAFFDYDRDGDLDVYLTNHGMEFYGRDQSRKNQRRDRYSGDKLYRNDGDRFSDVTAASGIYERAYSYGLGVGIADLNQDGWEDIYVSNDFYEHDYLYLNQGDGTFLETIKEATRQISYFGMGNDLADVDNDGLIDIMVVDMMPQDHVRRHTNLAGLTQEKFWEFIDKGYHFQYMYNSLNVNNGNGTFSNLAHLAGVAQTDWSWAPLFADFDNDGHKDIFITNGLRKDVLNLDFINHTTVRYQRFVKSDGRLPDGQLKDLLGEIPSEPIANFAYRNTGGLQFEAVNEHWGLTHTSFSNGAAYGDLDNDGDLDLVVNNLDTKAFVYRNDLESTPTTSYLKIQLAGPTGNPSALGTKVWVSTPENQQYQQLYLTRGYQSSVEPILHFGLGAATKVQLKIQWPDLRECRLDNIASNQTVKIDYQTCSNEIAGRSPEADITRLFERDTEIGSKFRHRENSWDDFDQEFLLPYRYSALGPVLAVADVNADGLDDVFVGGSAGFSGQLLVQKVDQSFMPVDGPWTTDSAAEDGGACFFDVDLDGDLDLFVSGGGCEFEQGHKNYSDRLYLNQGSELFNKANYQSADNHSSGCIKAGDFDADGDLDLFVAGRQVSGGYPQPATSQLLENQQGTLVSNRDLLPDLQDLGMVTDAQWTDFDSDGRLDLVVVGEWMSPTFFKNTGQGFINVSDQTSLPNLSGWYFSIESGDFDEDGDPDYIVGNLGLNHRFQASQEEPFEIFAADFDENGDLDPVLAYWREERLYPVYGRHVLQEQLNFLKDKYPLFHQFAEADIPSIFGRDQLEKSIHYQSRNFASLYIENLGDGTFTYQPLPIRAQVAPIQDLLIDDYDADGHLDLLIAGNLYGMEHRTPRSDAGVGLLLLGNGQGEFTPLSPHQSGLFVSGDVKALVPIRFAKSKGILIGKNDDFLELWTHSAKDL